MPLMQVRAQGYFEHTYSLESREGFQIKSSSFSHRVIAIEYIGQGFFPPHICEIRDLSFNLSPDGKSADIRLRYACSPNNACPNFLIEFSWEEE